MFLLIETKLHQFSEFVLIVQEILVKITLISGLRKFKKSCRIKVMIWELALQLSVYVMIQILKLSCVSFSYASISYVLANSGYNVCFWVIG